MKTTLKQKGYKSVYNRSLVVDTFIIETFDGAKITLNVLSNGFFFFWAGRDLIGYTDNSNFAFSIKDTAGTYTLEEIVKLSRTGKL